MKHFNAEKFNAMQYTAIIIELGISILLLLVLCSDISMRTKIWHFSVGKGKLVPRTKDSVWAIKDEPDRRESNKNPNLMLNIFERRVFNQIRCWKEFIEIIRMIWSSWRDFLRIEIYIKFLFSTSYVHKITKKNCIDCIDSKQLFDDLVIIIPWQHHHDTSL